MVSTWVTKPLGHAEVAEFLVNPAANYSCQQRQLRLSGLIPANLSPTFRLWAGIERSITQDRVGSCLLNLR